jgi:hypothetical protein
VVSDQEEESFLLITDHWPPITESRGRDTLAAPIGTAKVQAAPGIRRRLVGTAPNRLDH